MNILFVGDDQPYSEFALNEVIRLAMNTWADVTLLGSLATWPGRNLHPADHPLGQALHRYREIFLKGCGDADSPYAITRQSFEWLPQKKGVFEELLISRSSRKELRVRLRLGPPVQEILQEEQEGEYDLIILGCTSGGKCAWTTQAEVPHRVASEAAGSVLLVKEAQPITRIRACLDQSFISQDSLELITQMATIHGAQLELIGLTQEGSLKKEVYRRLIEIGDYYEERQIAIRTQLAEISEFESLLGQKQENDLLALFMGKKSLLDRFFPREWISRFVSKCPASVLVMR